MKRLLSLPACLLCVYLVQAQLLTWSPAFPKDNDTITIVLDASKGSRGLFNYSNPANIYVHTGVTTNLSDFGGQQWLYVNGNTGGTWGSATPALKATSLGNNKFQYTIYDIRTFFGVPAGETIRRISILFRDANGDPAQVKKAANTDGSDMYIPVYDDNIATRFSAPLFQPKFIPEPEPITRSIGENIAITAIASRPATLNLYMNGSLVQSAAASTSISANPTITSGGNITIIAEAIDGGLTRKDSFRFFVAGAVNIAPLPAGVKDGINYHTNNTEATLVLYAPGKNRVSIIGEPAGNSWIEQSAYLMNKTPDGNRWWLTLSGLNPGQEYAFQYLVDGTLKIAEPYTEKILSSEDQAINASTYPNLKPYPGSVTTGNVSILQTNAPGYNWRNVSFTKPDKRNLVIYELLVRDFIDAHNWQTMIDTLSYLQRLGINAIELMPVGEFEGNDSWGYNPAFNFAPDKYYGTREKLKEFIDSCHQKQIAVILDIVPNHNYGQSPLAQLYWNSGSNRPANDNPWFNPVQPHAFGFGQDFNHESAATKYYWHRVFDHWLREYRIDGYRWDFTKGITQKPSANDGEFSAYDQSRIDILKNYADTIEKNFPGTILILEHLAAKDEEQALQNMGFLLWSGAGLHHAYNEATMGYHDGNKSNFSSIVYNSNERGFSQPYLVGYMESHDEERLMYKNLTYGNASGSYLVKNETTALKRMEAANALFLAIPGPKMIWQFGERGYDKSIFACPDNTIPQPYQVNGDCKLSRKEPRWQYMQSEYRRRLFEVNAALIKLRKTHPALFTSSNFDYNLVAAVKYFRIAEPNLAAYIVANFDVVPQTHAASFQNAGTWYDYLTGETISATGTNQNLTLQPGEYHVFVNKNIVNAITTPVIDISNPRYDLAVGVFPNPGRRDAAISVELPQTGKVEIRMMNMTGQQIATVYSGVLAKGQHRLPLADKINNLPTGLYFLKVQAGNQSGLAKFMIQ